MLNTFILKNGIKVATYNLPDLRSLHLSIIVKGGSLVEDPKKAGVAHFMEHMLVQGIPSYPTVEELSGYIESLAGTYNASTSLTSVDFGATVPASHLEDIVRIASEVFFSPLFVEESIEKERRAVIDEITQRSDSLGYKNYRFFRDNRYKADHPLTHDTGGTLETVKKLTRDDMIEYWQNFFLPKNTYLLISGKFDPKILNQLLDKYFSSFNQSNEFPGYPKMSNADFSARNSFIREDKDTKACYIDVTFPSISLESSTEEKMLQNLNTIILGKLRNSRLFKVLRYQKGLVYHIGAGASTAPGIGYGFVDGECVPEHLDEVLQLTVQELKSYVEHGPTEEELSNVKNFVSNRWLMSFDHPSAIADWIESDLLWRDKILLPEDTIEMINPITTQDLTNFMQKNWDFSKLNVTLQGAVKNTKANRQKYLDMFKSL